MAKRKAEKSDPWRDALDGLVGEIDEVIGAWMEPWSEAEEAEEIAAAARAAGLSFPVSKLQAKVKAVGRWYCQQHNAALKEVAKLESAKVPKDLLIEADGSWLLDRCKSELAAVKAASRPVVEMMLESADFIESNDGFSAFLQGAADAATNPFKSLQNIFGESDSEREGKRLDRRMDAAVQALGEAVEALQVEVDSVVVDRWNDETVEALNKVTE